MCVSTKGVFYFIMCVYVFVPVCAHTGGFVCKDHVHPVRSCKGNSETEESWSLGPDMRVVHSAAQCRMAVVLPRRGFLTFYFCVFVCFCCTKRQPLEDTLLNK